MTTKGIADIVFCIDASQSMQPCFDQMRKHINDFIASLESNQQFKWDWRIDFLAHRASDTPMGEVFQFISVHHDDPTSMIYPKMHQSGRFFTKSIDEFRDALARVQVQGDEAPLIALDCCLDFPWRDAMNCHRVVVLMTDEPFETGAAMETQRERLPELIRKIQQLRVMLFIVAPESEVFDELSAVDKSEYEVMESMNDGLSSVNFQKILSYIGKSISVQSLQAKKSDSVTRGLYGQSRWAPTDIAINGR